MIVKKCHPMLVKLNKNEINAIMKAKINDNPKCELNPLIILFLKFLIEATISNLRYFLCS